MPIKCNINKHMYCIYSIDNVTNGKRYIGKTNFSTFRHQIHMNNLKRNKHHNKQMQIDFNNGDLFEINLIYQLPDKTSNNLMLALENLYIDKYNTINEGYNKFKNNLIDCQPGDLLEYMSD